MSETPPDTRPIITKTAPFGYQWQGESLVVSEPEAAARRLLYELFLTHHRKKTVARLLNEAGHRTRNGALFSDTAVDRLLRDASATGTVRIVRDGKPHDAQLEPLVSVETWRYVTAILSDEHKPLKQSSHLFAGLIFCACGGRMSVPSGSQKYVCQKCRRKIETDAVEAIFVRQLTAFPLAAFGITDDGENNADDAGTLEGLWRELPLSERRLLVEQLVGRLEVGVRRVAIRFAIGCEPTETAAREQQHFQTATEPFVRTPKPANQHTKKEIKRKESEPKPGEAAPPAETQDETNAREAEKTPQIEAETMRINAKTASETAPTLTEPLLNETAAAKFLGISRMTLLRKRNAGEINYFRVGFRVLYSKEKHLAPFLAKCESAAKK